MSIARNRYQLGEGLYSDGTVSVYRAHDTLLNRPVVVETVAPAAATSNVNDHLIHKAQQAVRGNLPHVAALFNQYADGDRSFLVWEEVAGQPVSQLVPLPPAHAAGIAGIVAETAQSALARRLPLPPLQANNVYLGPDDQVHITNYGLHQGATTNAQATVALGHLLYEMLGEHGPPTPLHSVALQAMSGQIPTVDGFIANLRRIPHQERTPTVAPSQDATTVKLDQPAIYDPPTRPFAASPPSPPAMPRTTPYTAPGGRGSAQPINGPRRPPAALPPRLTPPPSQQTGGFGWLLPLLGMAAAATILYFVVPPLLGLVDGGALSSGRRAPARNTAATGATPDAATTTPAPSPSPSAAASVLPSASGSPAPVGIPYVVVTAGGEDLPVQAEPSTSSASVTTLRNGTIIEVVGEAQQRDNTTWVPVRAGDVQGWANLQDLRDQRAASPPPSVSAGPILGQLPTPLPGDDARRTPTPTPNEDEAETGTPTPTPDEDEDETGTPTPTPNEDETGTPTPTPNEDETGTPTPTPNGEEETGTPPLTGTGEPFVVAAANAERLVVRSGPDSGAQRVGAVNNGTVVEVIGERRRVDGRNWVPIRSGDLQGWVPAGALREP